MQSITTDVAVHVDGREIAPECRTLITSSGNPFAVLNVASVTFYASKDQLRQVRDTIGDYLCDDAEVPADDPAWDSVIDDLPTIGSPRPSDWWASTVTLTAADIMVDSSWNPDDIPDDVGDIDWDSPSDDDSLPGEFPEFDAPDAPDFRITREPGYEASLNAAGITLLPISGGSPEAEPFEPSAEDWRDYREMQERATVQAYFAHRGYSMPTDDELSQLASHGCV